MGRWTYDPWMLDTTRVPINRSNDSQFSQVTSHAIPIQRAFMRGYGQSGRFIMVNGCEFDVNNYVNDIISQLLFQHLHDLLDSSW